MFCGGFDDGCHTGQVRVTLLRAREGRRRRSEKSKFGVGPTGRLRQPLVGPVTALGLAGENA
jgi:hypothetical protein